jgi:hypothetical protein
MLGLASPARAAGFAHAVSFSVPPIADATPVNIPPILRVDESDVARGYVDVAHDALLSVTTNLERCALRVLVRSDWIKQTIVRIDDVTLAFSPPRDVLNFATRRAANTLHKLKLRLHLAPSARVGEFAFPIALQVSVSDGR